VPPFDHALDLRGRHGMFEFTRDGVPDLTAGYCLDDNARALIVAVLALALDPSNAQALEVGAPALRFVQRTQRPDGLFHNRMNTDGEFTDDIGSPECIGRAIWACGMTMRWSPIPQWAEQAQIVFDQAVPHARGLVGVKARAYALLGLCQAYERSARARAMTDPLAGDLADVFDAGASAEWPWWEQELSWANARPPEAMLRAFVATGHDRYRGIGLQSLDFLAAVTQPHGMLMPIGNEGWYRRGEQRAMYDQQPIDACGMVDAWLAAAEVTDESRCVARALEAFEWFYGNNTERLLVAEPASGGCHDGLKRGGLNVNMGAESTLSYLQAHLAVSHAFNKPM
jgi:hypothetical protein